MDTNFVTQLCVCELQSYKGEPVCYRFAVGFEVLFVTPVKVVAFSCHVIQCHTSFLLYADWIRMVVQPQLPLTGVVCNSWC